MHSNTTNIVVAPQVERASVRLWNGVYEEALYWVGVDVSRLTSSTAGWDAAP